jgi:hypothetical protein
MLKKMHKNLVYIIIFSFFAVSCGNTLDSVKRGLTGQKANGSDEFLVKKKDPLILPPDFENLPVPGDRTEAEERISDFEKSLEITMEEGESQSSSIENSILKKIQKK